MADIYAPKGGVDAGETAGAEEGVRRQVRHDRSTGGFGAPAQTTLGRRFPFSVIEAQKKEPVPFSVTSNAKTIGEELQVEMRRLMTHCGMGKEMPENQWAFVKAVFIAHTMNSGSLRSPGRATFTVAGYGGKSWSWATDVVAVLAEGTRRFFRGMADEVVVANKELLAKRGVGTLEELEMIGVIEAVALDRGLIQYPWLAFDGADGCTSASTTLAERMAVKTSKAVIAPRAEDFIGNQYQVQKELAVTGHTVTPPTVKGGWTV